MPNITTVGKHGPDERYLRTIIPQKITKKLNINPGDTLFWKTESNKIIIQMLIPDN